MGVRRKGARAKFTGDAAVDLGFDAWLELVIGPRGEGVSDFASPAERERVWHLYKDQIIAGALPGDRPWAFWQAEAGGRPEDKRAWLRKRGLATPEDEAAWTREDEDAAWLEQQYAEGLEYNKQQAQAVIEGDGGEEVKD